MSKLFGEDGSDEETAFTTNKDFAKSYNKYRQKELLKKCKFSLHYMHVVDYKILITCKRVENFSER